MTYSFSAFIILIFVFAVKNKTDAPVRVDKIGFHAADDRGLRDLAVTTVEETVEDGTVTAMQTAAFAFEDVFGSLGRVVPYATVDGHHEVTGQPVDLGDVRAAVEHSNGRDGRPMGKRLDELAFAFEDVHG